MVVIFSIFIIGIVIVLWLNSRYKKTNAFINQCIDIKNYREGLPYNLKMVNLGSTYSKYAFGAYERLSINGANLSLQAQSLDIDYAILQQYKNHIKRQGIVFITLAACCMLYEGDASNPLYYMILDKKMNPKHSIKGILEGKIPLLLHPKRIKFLIKDNVKYQSIYDSMPRQIEEKQSLKIMNDMANGWIRMFHLKNLQDTELSLLNGTCIEKNTKILADIIELCIEEDFIPIVVVPPFSDRMNKYYSKEFTKMIIEDNVKKACRGKNIIFLNYQWDKYFQKNYSLFVDGGFRLNEIGSEIFIKRLVKDLYQYDIEISNKNYGKDILIVE